MIWSEEKLPPIERWFASRGWIPFDFQRHTWHAYLSGQSGLVHAPTGMGKTYSVWLGPLVEWLHDNGERDEPASALNVLWITPLRALAGDTAENLRAATEGLAIPWRIELRTGDTSATLRKKQRQNLPHALITTPESLSVLLSYPESSAQLRTLRCVIVDEWHELLGTKRGVQTELGLARLRTLSPSLRTWGLSATLGNLDQAMRTLLGVRDPKAPGALIQGQHDKTIVVDTLKPESVERFPWSGHLGLRLLPQVIAAIESARTTLLFTNVRSQAETWFQQILKARPDMIGQIALHHGSLDRDIRAQVESLLRRGEIKCVVCTSSLDLGVDFSPVDQVMQLGSPKGIARMMQRAGRSGHQPGAVSRIVGVPTNALELIEFAAAREVATAAHPHVEARIPLERPLDVLVQHLVTLASGDGFDPQQLHDEIRSTHAYANITSDEWTWVMDFVSQGGKALRSYPQFARVVNQNAKFVVASRAVERLHRMSIGTITSDSAMRVAYVGGTTLGMIEESFISRFRPGDRFVFAGKVLELVRVRDMVAQVKNATQRSGMIPRWMGSKSPLSTLLSSAVRRKLDEARHGMYNSNEMELVRPLMELQARWSVIPGPDELLIERTESRDGHHVYIYPFEGRLVHEGLSSLLAHRITRTTPVSLHVSANDYGLELLSIQRLDFDDVGWREIFSTENLVEDLLGCLNTTALARRQFREIARVAGLIFSGYPGQPKPTRHLQASSEMFFDVFSQFDPENLLLDQARREVLDRELEISRLRQTLDRMSSSAFRMISTERLTPLAFPIWADRIRTQHVTSEKWSDRIQRMVVLLEKEASRTPRKDERAARKPRLQPIVESPVEITGSKK